MKSIKVGIPEVLFENASFVVINKPPGYLSIPDRQASGRPCVVSFLKRTMESVFVVHRLDFETSGIMLFAKTSDSHAQLCKQFEGREVKKIYWALVIGRPTQDKVELNFPIAEDLARPGKMRVHEKGKAAHSTVEVLERFGRHSLVAITLHTGRTHQARLHCKHWGFPLLVDPDYGGQDAFYISSIKRSYKESAEGERPVISRVSLHARSLRFTDPDSGELQFFEADLPKDMNVSIEKMRQFH